MVSEEKVLESMKEVQRGFVSSLGSFLPQSTVDDGAELSRAVLTDEFVESFWSNFGSRSIFSVQPILAPASLVYYMKMVEHKEGAGDGDLGEIRMSVESHPVAAKTKKMMASASPEEVADAAALGRPCSAPCRIGAEVAWELDEYAVAGAFKAASNVEWLDWQAVEPAVSLMEVSSRMWKRNFRSGLGWFVAHPDSMRWIADRLAGKVEVEIDLDCEGRRGLRRVGSVRVGSRALSAFTCLAVPRWGMLMGSESVSFLDRAMVVSPYVFSFGPQHVDPDFVPRRSVLARFAMAMLEQNYLVAARFKNEPGVDVMTRSLLDLLEKAETSYGRHSDFQLGRIDGLRSAICAVDRKIGEAPRDGSSIELVDEPVFEE